MTYQLLSYWGIEANSKLSNISSKYRKLALLEARLKGHYKCPDNLWDRLHVELPELSRANCKQKGLYRDTFLAKLQNDLEAEIQRLSPLYSKGAIPNSPNERGLSFRTGYTKFGIAYKYPIYL